MKQKIKFSILKSLLDSFCRDHVLRHPAMRTATQDGFAYVPRSMRTAILYVSLPKQNNFHFYCSILEN